MLNIKPANGKRWDGEGWDGEEGGVGKKGWGGQQREEGVLAPRGTDCNISL